MIEYQHERRERKGFVGPRPGYPEPDEDLRDRMDVYLAKRGLSFSLATANGWYAADYAYAPRVVIPCSNSAGVPYFQARDMSGKAKLRYASPPASRDDSIVLVWPKERARGSVVCEGPMDALAAAALDYVGVAIMGNQPTDEVLEFVAKNVRCIEPVIVVPDADAVEFGPNVFCALSQRGISGGILVPPKKDIGEMTIQERRRFLQL